MSEASEQKSPVALIASAKFGLRALAQSIAQAYWQLHAQSRDAWTFELDVRPFAESW